MLYVNMYTQIYIKKVNLTWLVNNMSGEIVVFCIKKLKHFVWIRHYIIIIIIKNEAQNMNCHENIITQNVSLSLYKNAIFFLLILFFVTFTLKHLPQQILCCAWKQETFLMTNHIDNRGLLYKVHNTIGKSIFTHKPIEEHVYRFFLYS